MKCLAMVMLASTLFLGACSSNDVAQEKFKVAAILDFTGHYSQFGQEVKNGMELFLESNADSKFEVVYLDNAGSADKALELFNQATTDKNVAAVVTLGSWVSNPVAVEAEKKKVLHYAVGSAVFDHQANGNTVRYTTDVNAESIYMITYLKDYSSVALMYLDNDYGRGWQARLTQALGDKLTITRPYADTETNFLPMLLDVKAANPEIVVLISTREAVDIAQQVKQLEINAKLLGNRTILTDALLQEPAAEGLVFAYPDVNEDSPAFTQYIDKYNQKPSAFVAEGFDLATTLNAASVSGKFDREAVYNSYLNQSFSGLFSKTEFNKTAQANSQYKLMVVKNGNYQNYK